MELFAEAERAIKEVEDSDGELVVPAVNQLRYTGNHLVRYLSNPANKDELRDAEKHCKRAVYDAYEAAMLYYMLEYQKFQDDYRKVQISLIIPDYSEIRHAIEKARLFFRNNNENKTRGDVYRDGKQYLLTIKEQVEKFNANREELNKLIKKERRNLLFQLLGGCGAIAAILALILNFYTCTDENKQNIPESPKTITSKPTPSK